MKFKWTKTKQYDLDEIKQTVACNTLLSYHDSNEEFKIHTDARKFQPGSFISQKGKPIVFYSRKLTDSHKTHTVTEKEMLNIAETLKEFISILTGQILRIYTYHKNLT